MHISAGILAQMTGSNDGLDVEFGDAVDAELSDAEFGEKVSRARPREPCRADSSRRRQRLHESVANAGSQFVAFIVCDSDLPHQGYYYDKACQASLDPAADSAVELSISWTARCIVGVITCSYRIVQPDVLPAIAGVPLESNTVDAQRSAIHASKAIKLGFLEYVVHERQYFAEPHTVDSPKMTPLLVGRLSAQLEGKVLGNGATFGSWLQSCIGSVAPGVPPRHYFTLSSETCMCILFFNESLASTHYIHSRSSPKIIQHGQPPRKVLQRFQRSTMAQTLAEENIEDRGLDDSNYPSNGPLLELPSSYLIGKRSPKFRRIQSGPTLEGSNIVRLQCFGKHLKDLSTTSESLADGLEALFPDDHEELAAASNVHIASGTAMQKARLRLDAMGMNLDRRELADITADASNVISTHFYCDGSPVTGTELQGMVMELFTRNLGFFSYILPAVAQQCRRHQRVNTNS